MLSLEKSADSYLCFQSYFFFLSRSPASPLCIFFDSISSNIDKVLSINPSANVFDFAEFNVHHQDWFTYCGGTDRYKELYYNLSTSSDLTQMVSFPARIPDIYIYHGMPCLIAWHMTILVLIRIVFVII